MISVRCDGAEVMKAFKSSNAHKVFVLKQGDGDAPFPENDIGSPLGLIA
jgi:hypothetical protein